MCFLFLIIFFFISNAKANETSNFGDAAASPDIDTAVEFLDKKFPEIRKLFKMKYKEEAEIHNWRIFDKTTIDKMFEVLDGTRAQISREVHKMLEQSSDPFQREKSICSKKGLYFVQIYF